MTVQHYGAAASARSSASGSAEDAHLQASAAMSDAEFKRVSDLVLELTGIVIKPHKREMVQSRLGRRLRATSINSYGGYLDFVASPAGAPEMEQLINAVTTNLTSFFRESHHFDHLRKEVLDVSAGAPRLRIWSAASSSGEEPYSIAMTVASSAAARHSDLRILATDLDTNMLAVGRAGVYPSDRMDGLPDGYLNKFSTPSEPGKRQINADLRAMIQFNHLNLLNNWPMKGQFDAVFCRNVLIYFDVETKKSLVDRMANILKPNGALYLGHSESLLGDHALLISEGRTIYRRRP